MTLPNERTRAVVEMERAVVAILPFMAHDRPTVQTVRVPRELLQRMTRLLRHYPTEYDMKITAEKVPELWG